MNTTKLSVFLLALLVSVVAFGQKGSVTKADSYRIKEEYSSAKAEIDVAITIEKNAAKSRTWFVRGQIYEAIAKSTDMAINSIDPDALTKSMEAYNKVFEMEKENSNYYGLATINVDALWGDFLNKGGNAYGEEDYAVALSNFEKGLVVKPGDSTTLLYAGAAAQQLDNKEKTIAYYSEMVDKNYASESVYSTLIYMYRVTDQNEIALKTTIAAKEAFPDNKTFASEELSLLMILNKLGEAKTKLIAAIKEDPSVINNHLNLAVLYDNEGTKLIADGKVKEGNQKLDSAKASYGNALELEADNYVANYNLGAILVNNAKEYLDQVRDMDLKTYDKKGPALEEKAKVLLKEALPFFEKVTEIKAEDIDAWTTLQTIYQTLKMYDKAEAAMAKVEELEQGQ